MHGEERIHRSLETGSSKHIPRELKESGHRSGMKSRGCADLTSRKEQMGEGKVHSDRTCYCSVCGLAWSLGPDSWC